METLCPKGWKDCPCTTEPRGDQRDQECILVRLDEVADFLRRVAETSTDLTMDQSEDVLYGFVLDANTLLRTGKGER
jgi:hypothetical protein